MLRHRYAEQLAQFGSRHQPLALQNARVLHINQALWQTLDLPVAEQADLATELFAVNSVWTKHPFAQKYGGHQFGVWNSQLGDGRGVLLGEKQDLNGHWHDLHLKGAGPTAYARMGDGRAVLRSTIREYLASVALPALGIPSSQALCLLASDQQVVREQFETGAALIRTAPSHLRFGHYEYYHHHGQTGQLDQLFAYTFAEVLPEYASMPDPHRQFFTSVVQQTAEMVAAWQVYGFCHGVMNTDNMSIHGITFDYGPFAMMDNFAPSKICNHSDQGGRYAFNQQPSVALWNLQAFAQAFTAFVAEDDLIHALNTYEGHFYRRYQQLMAERFGLLASSEQSQVLSNQFLRLLAQEPIDYHQAFSLLTQTPHEEWSQLRDHFIDRAAFDQWLDLSQGLTIDQGLMQAVNPLVVLRNQHLQQVISACEAGDDSLLRTYFMALSDPFEPALQDSFWAQVPAQKAGQLSCSS